MAAPAYSSDMLQAILAVSRVIAVATNRWRLRAADRHPMRVEISVLKEKVEALREQNDLLRARLGRIPPRHRPHYRRHERLAILAHAARYGLSVEKAARAFVVTVGAILGWKRDARSDQPIRVQPKPPVNKLPELVADLARRIKREWPRWGTRRIAGVLARLGIAMSRTTVQTFLKRSPTRPVEAERPLVRRERHLVAKHPGHLWFLDFTRVGGVFRSVVVGAIVDGYSRKVLALAVAPHEPSALFAVRLVRQAIREFGPPSWMVTDHGTQLTAKELCHELRRRRIGHRYGAVLRHGSISVIERFWKSMKQEYAHGLVLFRSLLAIQRKLLDYVHWFNEHRPHQGLDQRTPDDVYYGRDTRAKSVPLRGELAFETVAGDHSLPALSLRAA